MEFITKDAIKPEDRIILDLRNNDDGTVSLTATHVESGEHKILMIFSDGKAFRVPSARLPGIECDESGYIIVEQ